MKNNVTYLKTQVAQYSGYDFVKYAFTGVFNTGVTFVVYSMIVLSGTSYLIANFIAWIVGIIVSFTLNSRYVFKKSYQHKRFLTFVISNMLSLLLSTSILKLLIDGLCTGPIIASLIAIPFVLLVNFSALKFVVFR